MNGRVWNFLLFDTFGLKQRSKFGDSVHFFFFDFTKIALLLVGITFAVTVARSFITLERTRALLGGKREGVGNILAASAGVVTPFCSCSAVPVFIGFLGAGVPIGVTMSFLIASPLINEIAVVLAVLVGIPLYSNAAGVMPIVQALYDKGLPMGTLLAFMMSVVALSLPEMILLRRVLKPQLLLIFIAVVGSGIIFVWYLFNAIL